MLFLSYQLALKKTLLVYKNYSENLAKKEQVSNVPKQLAMLTQKERAIDEQLKKLNVEESSLQSNLLKTLNRESELNNVKIIDFNAPHHFKNERKEIETFIFDLEGSYIDVLKTINSIENNGSLGSITHFKMEKLKNYRTKKTYLQAKVFLEQQR